MSEMGKLRLGACQLFMAGMVLGLGVAALATDGPVMVVAIGALGPLQAVLGWGNIRSVKR